MSHLILHPPGFRAAAPPLVSGESSGKPRLTLIGAGPGDPDLITLKAVKALSSANVVMYDALVNEALFQHVPASASLVYAGKRKGDKSFTQEEINERIVAYARCCGHVVRLKGGDPFVFGRGLEELAYAQANGLETDYIPGISSALAAPAAAGISITLRGASRGFWVLTGTTDTGELNPEIGEAARTNSTVVILMGLSKIAEIAARFEQCGKGATAVAIIQHATLPEQNILFSTVSNMSADVQKSGLGSPAVLVIGETVDRRFLANWTSSKQEADYAAQ